MLYYKSNNYYTYIGIQNVLKTMYVPNRVFGWRPRNTRKGALVCLNERRREVHQQKLEGYEVIGRDLNIAVG